MNWETEQIITKCKKQNMKQKLKKLYFLLSIVLYSKLNLIWFDLSHTPIWHQPEVGPCGKTMETIKELNEKKILRPNPKIKNLFSRQKRRGVMTSFRHFSTNESYNPCPHKKKKTKIKKTKSNSSASSFRSSALRFHKTVLNRFYMNLCIM